MIVGNVSTVVFVLSRPLDLLSKFNCKFSGNYDQILNVTLTEIKLKKEVLKKRRHSRPFNCSTIRIIVPYNHMNPRSSLIGEIVSISNVFHIMVLTYNSFFVGNYHL